MTVSFSEDLYAQQRPGGYLMFVLSAIGKTRHEKLPELNSNRRQPYKVHLSPESSHSGLIGLGMTLKRCKTERFERRQRSGD